MAGFKDQGSVFLYVYKTSNFPSCAGLSHLRSWLDLMFGVAGYIF